MKIYFWHIDEESEWVAINEKGMRFDVVVQIGDKYYPQFNCVNYEAFIMRMKYFMEKDGYYMNYLPRLILVKEVTKDCIIETIKRLKHDRWYYFNELTSLTLQELKEFYAPYYEFPKIDSPVFEDWHVVYDDGLD